MEWGPMKWYYLADTFCIACRGCFPDLLKKVLQDMHITDLVTLLRTDDNGSVDKGLVTVLRRTVEEIGPEHTWEDWDEGLFLRVRKPPRLRSDLASQMLIAPEGLYLFWPLPDFYDLGVPEDQIRDFDIDLNSEEQVLAHAFIELVDNKLLVPGSDATHSDHQPARARLNNIAWNPNNTDYIKNELKNHAADRYYEPDPPVYLDPQVRGLEIPEEMMLEANPHLRLHECSFSAVRSIDDYTLLFKMGTGLPFLPITPQWFCGNLGKFTDCKDADNQHSFKGEVQ